jgi:FkbM family methyltransferase
MLNKLGKKLGAGRIKTRIDALIFAKQLRLLDLAPQVVVDVGVRRGTPWLYNSFPDADFILVDPQRAGLSAVTFRPKRFSFLNKALGAREGQLEFKEQGDLSTFLERTELTATAETTETYAVEVTTLDKIIDGVPPDSRCGLKLDVEGFELEVLRGLDKHAGRIDFIIAELSIRNRFENSYTASDFIIAAREKGFRFANIMGRVPLRIPRFLDCLFLPDSSLRFD